MKPLTLLRLSLAGTRTDVLRVVLTAVSALLATVTILAALTVLAIPTPGGSGSNSWSEQYASPLLREPVPWAASRALACAGGLPSGRRRERRRRH